MLRSLLFYGELSIIVGRWRKRSLCCLIASFEKNKYLYGMATYSANLTSNKANEYAYR